MTITEINLTRNHWIIAIGTLIILSAGFAFFISPSPWPFLALGGTVLVISFWLPKSETEPEYSVTHQKGIDMELPSRWDQNEITIGVERYRGNPNLLRRYMEGIFGRFVDGQDTQTLEVRMKFLESFNKFAEVRRETFKWQRVMQKRATLEEDLADMQAEIALQKARNELEGTTVDAELVELEKKARRMEVQIRIAKSEKTIADIKKPEPPPPAPPPAPPTAEEVREMRLVKLRAREANLLAEKRRVDDNPNLTDDQRQFMHNSIDDQLALVHEGIAELL